MGMMIKFELVSQNTKLIYVTDRMISRSSIYKDLNDLKKLFFENESPVRVSIEIKEICHGEEED